MHWAVVILNGFFLETLVLAVTAKPSGSKSPTDQSVGEKFLNVFVGFVGAFVVVGAAFVPAGVSSDVAGTHDLR